MAPLPQQVLEQRAAAEAYRTQFRRDYMLYTLNNNHFRSTPDAVITLPDGTPSSLSLTPSGLDAIYRVIEKSRRITAAIRSQSSRTTVSHDDVMNWSPAGRGEPEALAPEEIRMYREMSTVSATAYGIPSTMLNSLNLAYDTIQHAEASRSNAVAGINHYIDTEISQERRAAFRAGIESEYGRANLPGSGIDRLADLCVRRSVYLHQWVTPREILTRFPIVIRRIPACSIPEGFGLQHFHNTGECHWSPCPQNVPIGEEGVTILRQHRGPHFPEMPYQLRAQEVAALQDPALTNYRPPSVSISPRAMEVVREAVAQLGLRPLWPQQGGAEMFPAQPAVAPPPVTAPLPRQVQRER